MAGAVQKGSSAPGEGLVKRVARKIAHGSPRLEELSSEALEMLARVVVAEGLKDELRAAAELEKIDYAAEKRRFIASSSRTGSVRTQALYGAALGRLEAFCAHLSLSPLELTPALADDWISELKSQGRAAATVRLDVSAASAFWTWLERRHLSLRNPFRGTRERPAQRPARTLEVPSQPEIEALLEAADPVLRAAIAVMACAGLRVGALPSLAIYGERFTARSKGREQSGRLPEAAKAAKAAIERSGLPLRSPFAGLTAKKLADRFYYLATRLEAAGAVRAHYSVHDLRHAFAVRIYGETGDLYRVEKALGHATIGVTETYLRSLGLE